MLYYIQQRKKGTANAARYKIMNFSDLMKRLESKSNIKIWQEETPRGIKWWASGIRECGDRWTTRANTREEVEKQAIKAGFTI